MRLIVIALATPMLAGCVYYVPVPAGAAGQPAAVQPAPAYAYPYAYPYPYPYYRYPAYAYGGYPWFGSIAIRGSFHIH
jgi:hypothetical protein